MSTKTFYFQKQLTAGKEGENLMLKYYHMPLLPSTDRKYDFRCVHTGHKVEIKTDTYDISRTPYFFFERYSNLEKQSPGGPWRASQDRVPIFVYFFVKNNRYFEFKNLPKMLQMLKRRIDKGTLQEVKVVNKGWVTVGYKVPRELVQKYWTEYEFNPALDRRAVPVQEGLSQELHSSSDVTIPNSTQDTTLSEGGGE
jgi:hypothetical protein